MCLRLRRRTRRADARVARAFVDSEVHSPRLFRWLKRALLWIWREDEPWATLRIGFCSILFIIACCPEGLSFVHPLWEWFGNLWLWLIVSESTQLLCAWHCHGFFVHEWVPINPQSCTLRWGSHRPNPYLGHEMWTGSVFYCWESLTAAGVGVPGQRSSLSIDLSHHKNCGWCGPMARRHGYQMLRALF